MGSSEAGMKQGALWVEWSRKISVLNYIYWTVARWAPEQTPKYITVYGFHWGNWTWEEANTSCQECGEEESCTCRLGK